MKKIYGFLVLFFCVMSVQAQYNFPTCFAEWDSTNTPYDKGQEVSLDSKNYRCKWNTLAPPPSDAWELVEPCGDGGLGTDYSGNQRIIGYLPTWVEDYDIKNNFNPEVVTNLNISFLQFKQNNNNYNSTDFASISFDERTVRDVDSVLTDLGVLHKAHAKNVKVSVALGGATDFAFLWLMAKYQDNDAKMDEIATLVANYVNSNGLDGVDLDMECWWADPAISGTSDQGGRVRGDKWGGQDEGPHPAGIGLKVLCKKLRQKLPNKLISGAVFGTSWYGNNYDDGMVEYMDWLGLMSYDFTGSWNESPTGPHSSLYKTPLNTYPGQSDDNPIYSAQDALEYWMGFAPPAWNHDGGFNVPKAKLTFGVPVYGYDFSERKPDGGNGFKFVPYRKIIEEYPNAATSYDPQDTRDLNGYIGADNKKLYYDTPKQAGAKLNYSKDNGHQGVIVWELTQDVNYNSPSSILKAINEAAGNNNPINNPPTVTWTSPGDGETIEQTTLSSIAIQATATDSDGAIQSFSFKHNNTTINASVSGSTYSANFTPSAFGEYSLIASATDNKGATTTKTITFTVKEKVIGGNTPPTISSLDPQNNSIIEQSTLSSIELKATITDDNAVDTVKFVVNTTEITPTKNGNNYTANWTPTAFGSVSFKVEATDNENESSETTVTFTVKEEIITEDDCDGVSAWNSTEIYGVKNTKVAYNGKLYQNKWWTQGETPGSAEVWEFLSNCDGSGNDFCGFSEWVASIAYNGGDQVYYSQKIYKAKWWTQNNVPDTSNEWEYVSDCSQKSATASYSIILSSVVKDILHYKVNASNNSWIQMDLYDISGKLVKSNPIQKLKGDKNFSQDLSFLKSGIYIYKINIDGNTTKTYKIVKL